MEPSTNISSAIVSGLRQIGYTDSLLQENYAFGDWFAQGSVERLAVAAAFGQTPASYDTAVIGVARANGLRGAALVDGFRALGAPILLEIDNDQVREWAVTSTESGHKLIGTYQASQVQNFFVARAENWKPVELLRAKNIGTFKWERQFELFEGLLPELEIQIQAKLDPLLRDALSVVSNSYLESTGRKPKPHDLFKLVFWLLAAKVFRDRKIAGFDSLPPTDADQLLHAVAGQYGKPQPQLLNRAARQEAARVICTGLDFRNLSVDVLSQIWSTTLVDKETRTKLGIHRTSRNIVRYIVERTPFPQPGDDSRIVFEPCCGSATFLIGAMNKLRQGLFGLSPKERHSYFVQHLAGMEKDPFGLEISNLALTLADFPNPNGWEVNPNDVFTQGSMDRFLERSGVVLSNPPFEDFSAGERQAYDNSSVSKPAELISRILASLHPSGVLGMVLPRTFVDGNAYRTTRKILHERYAQLELTVLPDRAFEADVEVTLLIASEPIPHDRCRVSTRRVADTKFNWDQFERHHRVSTEASAELSLEEAIERLAIPDLPDIWEFLENYPVLKDQVSHIKRGIRWNRPMTKDGKETGMRDVFVKESPQKGYILGVAPKTSFHIFQVPVMKWLSVRSDHRLTKAWELPWDRPKVILPKSRKSRGPWSLGAFPDTTGVSCYQTYLAVWPLSYDPLVMAAILNGPVANAFVSTREGKTDVTIETLEQIPMPILPETSCEAIAALVSKYQELTRTEPASEEAENILKAIDATVLDGYRMPPRMECELLKYFNEKDRPTSHQFTDYMPDNGFYMPLSRYLAPDHSGLSADRLLKVVAQS